MRSNSRIVGRVFVRAVEAMLDRFIWSIWSTIARSISPRRPSARGTSRTASATASKHPATSSRSERSVDPEQLKALLKPYPADDMIIWPVDRRVGNVKNKDPSLIEPAAAT